MQSSECKIIHTGRKSAEQNMQFDKELLENSLDFSGPVLHFYEWDSPSATYGYFSDPASLLFLDRLESLDLVKRPTGGGIIFHIWDFAFSILVPANCSLYSVNTLDNYALINSVVLSSVKSFLENSEPLKLISQDGVSISGDCKHFCMAKPTQYDVMWNHQKIAGAAQRKTKRGFLHQGSICLQLPDFSYLNRVIRSKQVIEAMHTYTFPLLGKGSITELQIEETKRCLQEFLVCALNRVCLKCSETSC